MAPWPVFVLAGAAIGALTGLFGVGGSSIATPMLAVLGVPGLLAVASPLPATIPAALGAAGPYISRGEARPRAAGWTLLGALPAAVVGAMLSDLVGGRALLVASGLVSSPSGSGSSGRSTAARAAGGVRRKNRLLLVAASAGVGLFTGLLANGGGFLLVPMYLLVFGLTMRESAGTSLLVIASSRSPRSPRIGPSVTSTGSWPGPSPSAPSLRASPTSRLAQHVAGPRLRHAFGWFLIGSGIAFVLYRILGA